MTIFCKIYLQFIAVVQAVLAAGRHLRQLHIEEENEDTNPQVKTVRAVLLRKLILTASSASVISVATRHLSMLNKEAADRQDLQNLFIISDGNFPEVQLNCSSICLRP